jgi:hypothetical protein
VTAIATLLDSLVVPEGYPLATLSYSSLGEMESCPLRWKYKYMDGISSPSAPWLVLGGCVHKAIEMYYKGVEEPLATAEAMLRDQWEWASGLDKAIVQLRRTANAYMAAYPERTMDAAEQRYEVAHGETTLVAIVDLIEGGVLVDYKTCGRDFAPDWLQIGFSAALLREKGIPIERAEIRALRKDVTGDRVKILNVYEVDVTDEFIERQLSEASRRLEDTCARIRTDVWSGPLPDENGQKKQCIFACKITKCSWRDTP